jgi:hypothetical protein
MHSQPDQPRRGGGRRIGAAWPEPPLLGPDLDGHLEALRQYLESVRARAESAASWLETSRHYTQLINRDGVVPVTARFSAEDLAFLARAREELLDFAQLGLRLADLHQPLEAGAVASAVASDPSGQIQRCRSCMWRWPCPTFRILDELMADRPEAT